MDQMLKISIRWNTKIQDECLTIASYLLLVLCRCTIYYWNYRANHTLLTVCFTFANVFNKQTKNKTLAHVIKQFYHFRLLHMYCKNLIVTYLYNLWYCDYVNNNLSILITHQFRNFISSNDSRRGFPKLRELPL